MGNLKEYLRKNNDGEYILEVTDEREAQEPHAKHWIEVPKGCDYLISVFGVNSFIDSDMFAKFKTKNVLWSRKPMKEYLIKSSDGKYLLTHHDSIGAIEIPDGAEVATVQANKISFWKDDGVLWLDGDGEWCEYLSLAHHVKNFGYVVIWQRHTQPEELPFVDDEPIKRMKAQDEAVSIPKSELDKFGISVSLNDQYAEIEKVRQSAWQKQEGGSHYKNLKIQPMQYALENKLDYAQANVVKYVTRHKEKNGKEDLLKAIHNIELMIEFYYGGGE